MRKKKSFLLLTTILLLNVACQNNTKLVKKETKTPVETTDIDNFQTTINFGGSYFGVLPCASCPGINTLITINTDGTYEKTVEYLASNDIPETTKGKFTLDKTRQVITMGEHSYLVAENQLFTLDENYKKIEGELAENYILTKTELEPALDSNEGYTLQVFTGNDNKNYNIIFNTNPKIPTAFVQTDGFEKILSQTQAWAKGAEYSGNNIKLTVKDNKATLIIKNKKVELKEK